MMRMRDANCVHHLIPLARSSEVSLLRIVRPDPQPAGLPSEGIAYVNTESRFRVLRVLKTLAMSMRYARKSAVRGIVSFNGIPYGAVATLAGMVSRKPVHVGFVGTEAHRLANKRRLWPLDLLLRRAHLVTVPGPAIGAALEARGYEPTRIRVLPHSVDSKVFYPPDGDSGRDIDVLFVGALTEVKQVDRLIEAIPTVRQLHDQIRVAIVGDGPLRSSLEELAVALGVADCVEFVGHQAAPAEWFRRARVAVIASLWEGFPFVLVQAMCSGAIPIATRVGSIPDVIESGRNGLLLDSNSAAAIADAVSSLLGDPDLEEQLRTGALGFRDRFSYASATALWNDWLARL